MENIKHSNFKIGDVDSDKWEFLISPVKGQKVSKCEVCEYFGNMRLATTEEINIGYANELKND